ncbi:transposase [Deltaproteobacteria bacterium TL4]
MRIMTLMILKTRFIIDIAHAAYKGKKTGESSLMIEILERLELKQIPYLFHFDALFYSTYLVHWIHQKNQFFLMKVRKSVKFYPIYYLSDGSYIAEITHKVIDPLRSRKGYNRYNKVKIRVRVIDFKVKGFQSTRLITNILDEDISAKELVIQYHQRWEIEIGYFDIKSVQCATLKGQTPTLFRSKRSDLVKQELYAILIVYNMIRYKIWNAAEKEGVDPRTISFLDSLQWIIDASNQLFGKNREQRQKIFLYLSDMILQAKIDRSRRKRKNPRAIKQRSSSFPLKKAHQQGKEFDLDEHLEIIKAKELSPLLEENKESNITKVDFKTKKKQKNMKELFFEQVINFINKIAA